MRQHYAEFVERGAEILCIGPDDAEDFRRYWSKEQIPFPGLADPEHVVADRYDQEVNLFKLGRMPLLLIVDREGMIRYQHHAASMADIPRTERLLAILERLNERETASTNPKEGR